MSIVILAGGVGGAKMVDGFAQVLGQPALTVIGNVADDTELHGLWISPDIDTITYTLADVVDHERGWGYRDDTFDTMERLGVLGGPTWMNLGDRDFATHIHRTMRRHQGARPTEIAAEIAARLGAEARILLPTDDTLATMIETPDGVLDFQQFFVREKCGPAIRRVWVEGQQAARPTPEALDAIAAADVICIAPSNPIASIAPIIDVPGIREALQASKAIRFAVSPLVGGQSLKGPSDRMMRAAGHGSDAVGVARFYDGLIDAMVIDGQDRQRASEIAALGLDVVVMDTLMPDRAARARLANEIWGWVNKKICRPRPCGEDPFVGRGSVQHVESSASGAGLERIAAIEATCRRTEPVTTMGPSHKGEGDVVS